MADARRESWAAHLDFIMAAVSYAVGLGNIWRFPYLCYRNGGGAFLLPYFLVLVVSAIPLLFQQMAVGQFCSGSSLACRSFSPVFKGLGYYMRYLAFLGISQYNVVISWAWYYLVMSFGRTLSWIACQQWWNTKGIGYYNFVLSVLAIGYYNVVVSWAWYYLMLSLRKVLPWAHCQDWWNTHACSDLLPDVDCAAANGTAFSNGTCYGDNGELLGLWSYGTFVNTTGIQRVLPSEEYFSNRLLRITSGVEDMGTLRWENALVCLFSMVVVFLCVVKGIKTAGKVSYVVCLLPYVILVVLLIRACLLPGALDGIRYFVIPRWERLKDIRVWYDAAAQIFYSIGVGGGIAVSLASYNDFRNNVLRDTLLVAFFNTLASILSGLVIFTFLGFLAHTMRLQVDQVATAGPGLAFVIFPELVTRMPLSPLWSVLFFVVLIMLGLGTALGSVEHFVACIMDEVRSLRRHRALVTAGICLALFAIGLPMCTEGGVYILQIFDHYLISYGTVITVLLENISIAWVYGAERLMNDCTLMLGYRPSLWWRLCWKFFCPTLVTFILVMMLVNHTPVRYGIHYYYPLWADVIGWVMVMATLLIIPCYAVFKVYREPSGSLLERLRQVSRPAREWGPYELQHRRLVDYAPGFVVDPWNHSHELEKLATDQEPSSDNPHKHLEIYKNGTLTNNVA